MSTKYVDILVSGSGPKDTFTYAWPEKINEPPNIGLVVRVPLKNKLITGVVIGLRKQFSATYEVRDVKRVVDPLLKLTNRQIELAKWMSDKYLAPYSDCIMSFLPVTTPPPKNIFETNINNDAINNTKIKLNDEQLSALEVIRNGRKPILLHGVTGSGKTEIYIESAREALALGRSTLILVPEIALTPQTLNRFESQFNGLVVVWHSGLTDAERRSKFWQILTGKKQIIVGSRSALFLPIHNLGLIVIDEEHEKSYFQESTPRYNSIEVAEQIAILEGAKLILGSATPSLESVWKASTSQYLLAKLTKRPLGMVLPETILIDLKQEKLLRNRVISGSLENYIRDVLDEKKQVVLLLNRRGYSTVEMCGDCGYVQMCSNCNVPLTAHFYNKQTPVFICHHCHKQEGGILECPICKSVNIKLKGFGTERVDEELKGLFPEAKVLRMDKDTTADKTNISKMYNDFANQKYDILLGTQMIAKGWDIPNVDLVGVLSAENGLLLPDYHASANTFNLLVQVSGRSGRAKKIGRTVIQTYQPENPIIRAAANHDYSTFIKHELKSRKEFSYPPFSDVVRLVLQHPNVVKCEKAAAEVANQIVHQNIQNVDIIGPSPCFLEKLHGKYRFQILIKIMDKSSLKLIKEAVSQLKYPWAVEINPSQVL
jgi:primosomal protein N' (replication factor Y)